MGTPSLPTDFFTAASMTTLLGATGATFIVTNGIQRAFNVRPGWLGLVVAEIIVAMGVTVATDGHLIDYGVGVINGFLVFASALGTNATSNQILPPTPKPFSYSGETPKRHFNSPWF